MNLTSCENGVTPPHPRVLGWFGTTALAMGGSNQMIFLITALFVGQGDDTRARQRRRPPADLWRSTRLGRGAGLDRAGPDVAEPRRRHLRRMRGSVPSL